MQLELIDHMRFKTQIKIGKMGKSETKRVN